MPKIITSDELRRWVNVGRSFVLVDVVTPESYQTEHLPEDKNATIVICGDDEKKEALYITGIKLSHAGYDDVYEFHR